MRAALQHSRLHRHLPLSCMKSNYVVKLLVAMVVIRLYIISSSWMLQQSLTDLQTLTRYQESVIDLNSIHTDTDADADMKDSGGGSIHSSYDGNRSKVPVRILSLGGSVTAGAKLNSPLSAYPFLISEPSSPFSTTTSKSHVSNLAIRATGSEYPSRCIQSMINSNKNKSNENGNDDNEKEEEFDVILLEFSINNLDQFDLLYRRLRDRYPQAIIVYIHLWSIWTMSHDKVTGEFLRNIPVNPNRAQVSEEELNKMFDKIVHDGNRQWRLNNHLVERNKKNRDYVSTLLQGPNDFVWTFPLNEDNMNDPIKSMTHLYAPDVLHLNENGHAVVAQGIRDLLLHHSIITHDGYLNTHHSRFSIPTTTTTAHNNNGSGLASGSWGKGDQCYSWYQTGKSPLVHEGSKVKLFVAPDKYGHEMSMENGVASILFENQSRYTVPLYIMHMVWSNNKYPKTKVSSMSLEPESMNANANATETSFVLNPIHKSNFHLTHFTEVGVAAPGQNIILFEVMEKKEFPLRVVAITMCGICEDLRGKLG